MSGSRGYEDGGVYFCTTVHTAAFSSSTMNMSGRTIRFMTAGGDHDTLPKLNYEESPRAVRIHFEDCRKMGITAL